MAQEINNQEQLPPIEQKNQPCYDKYGRFLGWYSRSIAVAGFVYCKNKKGEWCVLASERGKGTPDFQGYWNSCCGYLDFNEKITAALAREIFEETGVVISEDMFELAGYEDSPSANRQNVTFRFRCCFYEKLCEEFEFSHANNEKDEVGEIKWIPIEEVGNYKWAFGHDKRIIELMP